MTRLALIGLALLLAGSTVDVTRYEIDVTVGPDSIEASVVLHATAPKVPKTWGLRLADRMEIQTLTVNGVAVPKKRDGWKLTLDLSKLPAVEGRLRLETTVTGAPRQNVRHMIRTIVGKEQARIRSQYAWYPRVEDDAATYGTVVRVRKDWSARTAGRQVGVTEKDGRRVFTHEQEKPVRRIGLVAGPYEIVEKKFGEGFVFDAWTLPREDADSKPVLTLAHDVFEYYRKRFGKVGAERFSLVEMPESYGPSSGYGEAGYVLLGPFAFGEGGAGLVAHEIAHTWWGQEVGFARFASESLACYATLGYLQKSKGDGEARAERVRAVKAVLAVAAKGREVALADVSPWGAGMDYETYRAHAYMKGMMILDMVESVVGRKKMDEVLSTFIKAHRGKIVRWPDLRAALSKAGRGAKAIVHQWEKPGIPKVTIEHESRKSGKKWKVKGTLLQSGTRKPFSMKVSVVVHSESARGEKLVELSGAKTTFSMTTSAEPKAVLVDPEWRLLIDAPRSVVAEVSPEVFEQAFRLSRSPNERDPAKCKQAIRVFESVLAGDAGDREGVCWTGIGRCQFRLGMHEQARASLEKALVTGAGGPFHRAWVRLRLGNLADLRGERKKALEYYGKVTAPGSGASKGAVQRASRYAKTPYRE